MIIIQLGHPKIRSIISDKYSSLKEAFTDLFRDQEEVVYMYWYDIPIAMRYQQDISQSFDNILSMIWLLNKEEEGKTVVTLQTELFTITMKLHWERTVVDVVTKFKAHDDLYEDYANELNKHEYCTVTKDSFINEWNGLLRQLLIAFSVSGIMIKEGTENRKLALFQNVVSQIETYGQLYSN
jgi:DNA polymerase elongation subunit (family B)